MFFEQTVLEQIWRRLRKSWYTLERIKSFCIVKIPLENHAGPVFLSTPKSIFSLIFGEVSNQYGKIGTKCCKGNFL